MTCFFEFYQMGECFYVSTEYRHLAPMGTTNHVTVNVMAIYKKNTELDCYYYVVCL